MKRERMSRRFRPVLSEGLETRALLTMTATAQLPNVTVETGAAVSPVNLDNYFHDPDATADFAIFNTTLGTIPVLMTPTSTPLTVANFRTYINEGAYTDSIVHRSVPGFIWQAGGYQLTSTERCSNADERPRPKRIWCTQRSRHHRDGQTWK